MRNPVSARTRLPPGHHQVVDAYPRNARGTRRTAPMGHLGEMSYIVSAILYLDSAPVMTGDILHIDGGQSAGH